MIRKLKILIFCVLLVLSITATVYGEVTITEKVAPAGTKELVFSSKRKAVAKQIVDDFGNIIKISGKIPDGIVKQYYESSNLMFEFNYKDGKREDISRKYYENGNLLAEINFKNNKKDGIEKIYYENGKLKSEMNYKNGELEGMSKEYYESGNFRSERKYKKNRLHGVKKLYYENGKLRGKWKYKNGKRDGKTIRYYENGEIRYINTYTKGELIKRKEYDERGNLNLERDYPIKDKGEK